jgi:hypothetical protein
MAFLTLVGLVSLRLGLRCHINLRCRRRKKGKPTDRPRGTKISKNLIKGTKSEALRKWVLDGHLGVRAIGRNPVYRDLFRAVHRGCEPLQSFCLGRDILRHLGKRQG